MPVITFAILKKSVCKPVEQLWQSNIFGRSFNEIVGDDLQSKLKRMPEPAQKKMREALERIINEGGGGLICIIL